jgi:diguanylate cyclase (GGDEF)-like protein
MAATDPFSTIRGNKAGSFFEPYARLIQCLHPRTKGIVFYDATGALVWKNDQDLDTSLTGQVKALVQEAADPERGDQRGSQRLLQGSTPSYLLWLRDERGTAIGIVGITSKSPTMNSPPPPLVEVEKTLQPALQCLARELATLRRLPGADQDQVRQRHEQSEWLADKVLPLMNSTTRLDPLRAILAAVVDRTDSVLGALVLPDRSIRVVVQPEGWDGEKSNEALRRAHRQVLDRVQGKRKALITNRVRESDAEDSSYRMVAVPVLQRPDFAIGYLLMLKSSIASEFGANEQRLLERIAPILQTVVERDYDLLTHLHSAAGLEQATRQVLPPDSTAPATVVFVDIDRLSEINSRLDADAADRLIRRVGKLLRPPQVPQGTISARLSGGHFGCLLPRHDLDGAEEVATRIREAARKLSAARDSRVVQVRLRTGVAQVSPAAAGLRHALVAARAAAREAELLDTAPQSADDRPNATRHRSGRQLIPVFLREALRENRLRIYAQPMRPMKNPKLPMRLELLPRIVDTQGRLVTPLEFLASGPDPDALNELDRWVLTAALESIEDHASALTRQRIEFALNVSGRSLEISEFHDWICDQLRDSTVPADAWLFEISETVASKQRKDVERFARRMLSIGARVVLDDVGSAGTDAVKLRTHAASAIKMDGSLVRDVATDTRAQRLVEALAQWANASRMEIVAEQVESEAVRERLTRFGIDYIQGFVICEPQPLDQLLEELVQPPQEQRATGS